MNRSQRTRNPISVEWPKNVPENGAKLLFFSGGTALRNFSRKVIGYTHRSIHIITPFDSGGSSAELRRAFEMPAVGDIRNRMMALADLREPGNVDACRLFSHRLPKEGNPRELFGEIVQMARGHHPMVARMVEPARKIVCRHLSGFLDLVPETFNPFGASIGNLVLAAGYLMNGRNFEPVLSLFSDLLHVRGVIRPVINAHLHLAATLENGKTVFGQDRITGKECRPIEDRIQRVYLARGTGAAAEPADTGVEEKMRRLIGRADLICYPMGSFYSSLIANLLPGGIGSAISQADCPKIYIPNTGSDPEARGLGPADQVEILLGYLKGDDPGRIRTEQVLQHVILDDLMEISGDQEKRIRGAGVQIIRWPLITRSSAPYIDGDQMALLLTALASDASGGAKQGQKKTAS